MTNQESLRAFLKKTVPAHADDIMIELKPFFARADTGNYPLEPADYTLKEEAVFLLVSLFSHREVGKVVLVSQRSLCAKFEQPEWMTDEVYKENLNNLWKNLGGSLGKSFSEILEKNFWKSLGKNLWKSLRENLEGSLGKNIRENLEGSLGKNILENLEGDFWECLRESLVDILWYNIKTIFLFYIDFTITGKTEMAEKLKRLMRFQLKAIVLGEKKDEPGTWLVLCQ